MKNPLNISSHRVAGLVTLVFLVGFIGLMYQASARTTRTPDPAAENPRQILRVATPQTHTTRLIRNLRAQGLRVRVQKFEHGYQLDAFLNPQQAEQLAASLQEFNITLPSDGHLSLNLLPFRGESASLAPTPPQQNP